MSSIAIPPIGGGGGKPKELSTYPDLLDLSVGDNTLAFVHNVSGDSRAYNTSGWGFYRFDEDDNDWVLLAQQNNIAGEAGVDENIAMWLDGFAVDSGIAKSNVAQLNIDNIFEKDIVIQGSLTVAGSATFIHTDHLHVKDNTITINDGETGSGVTSITAGLEVDRGTEPNYFMLFDETSDSFKIGEADSLQKVATREDTPTIQGVASWDATEKFVTDAENVITKNLIPLTTETYSLGTSAYEYDEVHTKSILVDGKTIEVVVGEIVIDGVGVTALQTQVDTISGDLDSLETDVATISGDLDSLEIDVSGLQSISGDHETRIDALEDIKTTINTITTSSFTVSVSANDRTYFVNYAGDVTINLPDDISQLLMVTFINKTTNKTTFTPTGTSTLVSPNGDDINNLIGGGVTIVHENKNYYAYGDLS